MRADGMTDTDINSRRVNMQERLLNEIQLLVTLIEDTEDADPIDDDVITMRRVYRDCLNWRLEEMNLTSHPSLTGSC
jgi:hypothetical protein